MSRRAWMSMTPGGGWIIRMSETPTTTTSQKSIAIHFQFVLQCPSNLYCSTFSAHTSGQREILSALSHLYRSTPPICIALPPPFVSQKNLGGCGHLYVPTKNGPVRKPGCANWAKLQKGNRTLKHIFTYFYIGGTKVYTKGVFSSKTYFKCLNRPKRGLVYMKKARFQGKRRKETFSPKSLPGRCLRGTSSHSIGL